MNTPDDAHDEERRARAARNGAPINVGNLLTMLLILLTAVSGYGVFKADFGKLTETISTLQRDMERTQKQLGELASQVQSIDRIGTSASRAAVSLDNAQLNAHENRISRQDDRFLELQKIVQEIPLIGERIKNIQQSLDDKPSKK